MMIQTPFFVSGVPKSGTTWLGKLLDAHPQISCKGEACTHAFTKSLIKISNEYNELLARRAGKFSESNDFPPFTEGEVYSMATHFVELRLKAIADPSKPGLKFIGEKDPLHIANLPVLQKTFPEAQLFHIIRDGRSVVVSAWHHNLREFPEAMKSAGFDAFMDEAAERWGLMIKRARETAHLLGDRYVEVRYEDLVSDTRHELKRLLERLGAGASEIELTTCVEGASFEKLAQGRKRGEEDKGSFFRKGTTDDWKSFMTAGQLQRFNGRSKGMLSELGYI